MFTSVTSGGPSLIFILLVGFKKNRLLSIDFQIFDMKQVMYVTLKDFFFKEGNYQLIGGGGVPVFKHLCTLV